MSYLEYAIFKPTKYITIMPVKFKTVEKGEPGVAGGGVKKYYASKVSNGEVTLRALAKDIASSSTVSMADVTAVLESMIETMPKYLGDGRTVRLGDFGSLTMGINSRGEEMSNRVSTYFIV